VIVVKNSWDQEYKMCFSDLDEDDIYGPIASSGTTPQLTEETFEEMIRRKTNKNMKRMFERDG